MSEAIPPSNSCLNTTHMCCVTAMFNVSLGIHEGNFSDFIFWVLIPCRLVGVFVAFHIPLATIH
jgi:hypothetical protein